MVSTTPVMKVESKINIVSSKMSASAIIALLVEHGCPDVTDQLDLDQCGQAPVSGGGFGDVFRGFFVDRKRVAIKCPRLHLWQDAATRSKVLKRVARELHTWSCLNHPNILELLGLAQFRGQIAMVSPWMNNGTLLEYIKRNPSVDRYGLLLGISDGVVYLHQNHVVHGDIKGGNVLVSAEGIVKLAGFGCTQLKKSTLGFTATTSGPKFSTRWAAPEILLSESIELSKEADIYALGMTLLEVLTGEVPFSGKSDTAVLSVVVLKKQVPERPKSFPSFGSHEADSLWGLMMDSWAHDPSSRPDSLTVRNRLRHITPYKSELGSPLPSSIPDEASQQSLIHMIMDVDLSKSISLPTPLPTLSQDLVPFPHSAPTAPSNITRLESSMKEDKSQERDGRIDERLWLMPNYSLASAGISGSSGNGAHINSTKPQAKRLTMRIDDTSSVSLVDSGLAPMQNDAGSNGALLVPTPPLRVRKKTPPNPSASSESGSGSNGKLLLLPPPPSSSRNLSHRLSQEWSIHPQGEGAYGRQQMTERVKARVRLQSLAVEESGYMPDSDRKPSRSSAGNALRRRNSRMLDRVQPHIVVSESKPELNIPKTVPASQRQPTFKWFKGLLLERDSSGIQTYHGLNLTTGGNMAIKKVDLVNIPGKGAGSRRQFVVEALKSECSILRGLDHPNIVKYFGAEQTSGTLSVFVEYVSGDSITSLIRKHGKFEDEVVRLFSRQIVEGLTYLHESKIMHRNLKGGNILVDRSGMCKISDFSVSIYGEHAYDNHESVTKQESIFWMAPEILNNSNKQGYDFKVDIWSLGCVMHEMQDGQRPWSYSEPLEVIDKVGALQQAPPVSEHVHLSPAAKDFRDRCFVGDPAKRSTAAALQAHPWLKTSSGWVFKGLSKIGKNNEERALQFADQAS